MLEIDLHALPQRRPAALRCLDWSEQRPHVAGALGAAICTRALEARWVTRLPNSRAVRLTAEGRRAFAELGAPSVWSLTRLFQPFERLSSHRRSYRRGRAWPRDHSLPATKGVFSSASTRSSGAECPPRWGLGPHIGPCCGPCADGRGLGSFEPFGDERGVGVDADELRAAGAVVGELVRHAGRHDHDVARTGGEALVSGLEAEGSLDDDPGLVVGVTVQPRAVAGLAVVEDQRDRGAVLLTLRLPPGRAPALMTVIVLPSCLSDLTIATSRYVVWGCRGASGRYGRRGGWLLLRC